MPRQQGQPVVIYLIVTSLIWAFSFGLIKVSFHGVDADLVAAARLFLALAVMLLFFRPRVLRDRKLCLLLFAVGGVQYGLMYVLYLGSFRFLAAHEVALFTCFTPIYVAMWDDLEHRTLRPVFLLTALLAAAGAALAVYQDVRRENLLCGFWLVQGSNLCFAAGQVRYRNLLASRPAVRDADVFALLYLGAFLTALAAAALTAPDTGLAAGLRQLTPKQAWAIVYLGVLASGLCFFLWNFGARRTDAGTLAVLNNAKLPLAVAVSLLFFHEKAANLPRLCLGSDLLLAALAANEWYVRRAAALSRQRLQAEGDPRKSSSRESAP